jgi:hypothetical protein
MTTTEISLLGACAGSPLFAAGVSIASVADLPVGDMSGVVERLGFPIVVTGAAAWCAWRIVNRILDRAEKREDEARDMLNERHAESMRFASQVLEGNKLLTEAVNSNARILEKCDHCHGERRHRP